MKILETDGIELYFDKKTILNSVYIKAEKGEITGILGSNGCGKTSLFKIIFGSLKPKYKSIRIDSKHFKKPLYNSGKIKYLPQFNMFPTSMMIEKAFKLFKVAFDIFILEFESFKKYEGSSFSELSGGERRVIEIYLVLKTSSSIVLLDEPFSHIAPIYIAKIKELMRIEKEDKIILITDHLFKNVIEITDNIYLIKDGFAKKIKKLDELEFYQYANIS